MKKICTGCRSELDIERFDEALGYKDGRRSRCKDCEKERMRLYMEKRRQTDPTFSRKTNLSTRFGITLEQYEDLKNSCNGVCSICRNPETLERHGKAQSLSVDHNHETGKIRGLLCNLCNRAVGLVESKPHTSLTIKDYMYKDPVVFPEIESTAESRSSSGRDKQKQRSAVLKCRYGINLAQYNWLLEQQNRACGVCGEAHSHTRNGKAISLAVDHDHASGEIRGLLCLTCNRMLGALRERPDLLDELLLYLKKHELSDPVI